MREVSLASSTGLSISGDFISTSIHDRGGSAGGNGTVVSQKTNCMKECDKCDLHTADNTDAKKSLNTLKRDAQELTKKIADSAEVVKAAQTRCRVLTSRYRASEKTLTVVYNRNHAERGSPTEGEPPPEVAAALKNREDAHVDKL